MDPIAKFQEWLVAAARTEPSVPEAFSLATVDADGLPHVRMLLCKDVDERGFTFYTNLGSPKAQQLSATARAAMCFHWKTKKQQVRVTGSVVPLSEDLADAYFASRDRLSQIGAWASRQSEELPSRLALEARVARFTAKFGLGVVPRPEFWSGFRLAPQSIEFWQELPARLHRRERFDRIGDEWQSTRLYP